MSQKIRAIQYGCGPIGCLVGLLAARRQEIELVGAVDIDPAKVGRDLGEVAGSDKIGILVTDDAPALIRDFGPQVVFHTTSSSAAAVADQLIELAAAGVNVVSTCEELSYPWYHHAEVAAHIDEAARAVGVTILSTGINPGFLMDAWPLFMTALCQDVEHVRTVRIQDATTRRLPFQKKIGAGTTPEEFAALREAGTLRHVGLPESIAMIAAGLGWELDEITETIEPVIASAQVSSPFLTVEPGQAAGVRQVGIGMAGGTERIYAEFQAYIGASDPYDAVTIRGTPDRDVVIRGGSHGDIGTAAIVINAARRVVEAPAGLLTMLDMPIVTTTVGG